MNMPWDGTDCTIIAAEKNNSFKHVTTLMISETPKLSLSHILIERTKYTQSSYNWQPQQRIKECIYLNLNICFYSYKTVLLG